jgi:hypothetical protein
MKGLHLKMIHIDNDRENWDDEDDSQREKKYIPSHLRREAKIYNKLFGEGDFVPSCLSASDSCFISYSWNPQGALVWNGTRELCDWKEGLPYHGNGPSWE